MILKTNLTILRKRSLRQSRKLRSQLTPRVKTHPFLKDAILRRKSNVFYSKKFRRHYKSLPWVLRRFRVSFKSSTFFYSFLKLLPYPFRTQGKFFRIQSRVFFFWYDFAVRRYNIHLDFGIKQKKTISENALWLRGTRRGGIFLSN